MARWCRLCSQAGIPADPADLRLAPVPDTASLPRSPGCRQAARHSPSSIPGRRPQPALAPDRFAAVAAGLTRGGHHVAITGSAAERPLALDVARRAGLPSRAVLAGRTSLAGLAALTASARLVVSGDTGLAHLASAYTRPSVVLFGPVPPAEWGPPGTRGTRCCGPAAKGTGATRMATAPIRPWPPSRSVTCSTPREAGPGGR